MTRPGGIHMKRYVETTVQHDDRRVCDFCLWPFMVGEAAYTDEHDDYIACSPTCAAKIEARREARA
jgi:hypothetical protein